MAKPVMVTVTVLDARIVGPRFEVLLQTGSSEARWSMLAIEGEELADGSVMTREALHQLLEGALAKIKGPGAYPRYAVDADADPPIDGGSRMP